MDTSKAVVIITIILGIPIILSGCTIKQKSNLEKLTECQSNATRLYHTNRQIINKNVDGYTEDEQKTYYQRTENAHATDLQNCQDIYGSH